MSGVWESLSLGGCEVGLGVVKQVGEWGVVDYITCSDPYESCFMSDRRRLYPESRLILIFFPEQRLVGCSFFSPIHSQLMSQSTGLEPLPQASRAAMP